EPQPAPTRWEVELEFVQALANLQYLNFLAQNKYLEKEEFLNYLKYLEYWREPQYAKHLVYPNCLHVLTLLQSAHFREQILRQDTAAVLMNDMVNRWKEPQTM
ncbi:mediator complex subunit SOH1, partial [Cyberlindnera jadinii NRRL Y-1542]